MREKLEIKGSVSGRTWAELDAGYHLDTTRRAVVQNSVDVVEQVLKNAGISEPLNVVLGSTAMSVDAIKGAEF